MFAENKRDAQAGTYECVSSDQVFANIPEQIQMCAAIAAAAVAAANNDCYYSPAIIGSFD